jgi:hypothetical protein
LDIYTSPFDNFDNSKTKKESITRYYKGFNGYAPSGAILGEEDYAIYANKTKSDLK